MLSCFILTIVPALQVLRSFVLSSNLSLPLMSLVVTQSSLAALGVLFGFPTLPIFVCPPWWPRPPTDEALQLAGLDHTFCTLSIFVVTCAVGRPGIACRASVNAARCSDLGTFHDDKVQADAVGRMPIALIFSVACSILKGLRDVPGRNSGMSRQFCVGSG